ncbi:MAG: S41 family peptidase [Nitrospirae bacterium]|nr:S41 family peptidase [Nitrospirota bacterium]MBI3593503.1 S41 family peptidase [Nitrospirota bacterium]
MSWRNRKQATVTFTALVLMLVLGIVVGRGFDRVFAQPDTYDELKTFSEVLSTVQKNYVEEVKSKDLVYGAIKGMLNTLDSHSSFMPPEAYKEMQVDTKGEFGGLGIQIGIKENKLTVISPIEGTPADLAGIKAGDVILKVDGQSSVNLSLQEAVEKMRGPKGSKVVLTILRENTPDPLTFTLVRDIIKIQSVKSKMLDKGIGYIRVTQFQEHTSRDLDKALKKLKEDKMQSLILDLRNNPGGLLTSAIEISEAFLEPGKLVVFIKGRDGKKEEYSSNGPANQENFPMIVLVNEGSASASEIVSGALQDWGRAVVVGVQTFGKGSVQTILPLSDGAGLRLTTAKYYTPKGRSIQNVGIEPDITVKPLPLKDAKGTVMNRPILREKDLERHLKNETTKELEKEDSSTPPQSEESLPILEEKKDQEDIQLQKAIDLLKSWKIFKQLMPGAVTTRGEGTQKEALVGK